MRPTLQTPSCPAEGRNAGRHTTSGLLPQFPPSFLACLPLSALSSSLPPPPQPNGATCQSLNLGRAGWWCPVCVTCCEDTAGPRPSATASVMTGAHLLPRASHFSLSNNTQSGVWGCCPSVCDTHTTLVGDLRESLPHEAPWEGGLGRRWPCGSEIPGTCCPQMLVGVEFSLRLAVTDRPLGRNRAVRHLEAWTSPAFTSRGWRPSMASGLRLSYDGGALDAQLLRESLAGRVEVGGERHQQSLRP